MRKAFLALTLLSCTPTTTGRDIPSSREQQESRQIDIQKVSLGNIDFMFAPDSGFTEEEKLALRGHMEQAYARLSQTLGNDAMQFLTHTEISVRKTDSKEARGQTKFGDPTFKLNDKLELELQNDSLGKIELFIGEISEPNVAHEFTHLFAQSSYFLSEAFSEGMVYGLINHLYPNYYSSLPDFFIEVVRQKCVAAVFDKGWDYDDADTAWGKGVQDQGLQKLLHSEWAIVWGDFIAKHPEFPKRFFALILEERKKGKLDFSRDELWAIAEQVEPDFNEWRNTNGASVKPIEAQAPFFMVVTGVDQFSIFNLTAQGKDTSDGKLHAGFIKQAQTGESILINPGGQAVGGIPTVPFGRITIPGIPELENHSVTINATTVPFIDSSTCRPKLQ